LLLWYYAWIAAKTKGCSHHTSHLAGALIKCRDVSVIRTDLDQSLLEEIKPITEVFSAYPMHPAVHIKRIAFLNWFCEHHCRPEIAHFDQMVIPILRYLSFENGSKHLIVANF
jgi:hypothetical protein